MIRARATVAIAVAALDVGAVLVARFVDPSGDIGAIVVFTLGVAAFAVVGAMLDARVPGNVIGRLLLAAGTLMSLSLAFGTYGAIGRLGDPPLFLAGPVGSLGNVLFVYPFMIALIGIPLVFPDGYLASRRFRWVIPIATLSAVTWAIVGLSGPGQDAGPSGNLDADPLLGAVQTVFLVSMMLGFGAGALAIALRFRRGDRIERQQIKWLVAIVGLGAVVLPVSFVVPAATEELAPVISTATVLVLFAIPAVIGMAVLRYRLYEIDRIISRTIGWGVTTVLIFAVFVVVVVGLQRVLSPATGDDTLAVAGSTLVVAALFQPLRRRVHAAADRRFDRARYDARRTVDSFAGRLRDEMDLANLASALVASTDDAVRPAHAGLWLRLERRPE